METNRGMLMLKKLSVIVFFISAAQAHSLYPDLKTTLDPLRDHEIDTSTFPGKILLRFGNGVANVGDGNLEIKAGPLNRNGTRKVYQRIYSSHGGYRTRLAGNFVYHPQHGHTHFADFAKYKLRKITSGGGVGSIVASSSKVSFCLIDEEVFDSTLPNYNPSPTYSYCGTTVQGISVGWVDVYYKGLADQWIDITNVRPGRYWLESTADPSNRLVEKNERNNTSRIKVDI